VLPRDMSREHLRDVQAVLDNGMGFRRFLLFKLVIIIAGSLALDSFADLLRRGSYLLEHMSKEAEDGCTATHIHLMLRGGSGQIQWQVLNQLA
jgi:hypothetical protein